MNRRKSSSLGSRAGSWSRRPAVRSHRKQASETVGRNLPVSRADSARLPRVKIAVARETREGEARVAMVPELVGKLTALGYDVARRARARAGTR